MTRPKRETLARYAGLMLEYDGVTLKDVYDARVALETPMVIQLAEGPQSHRHRPTRADRRGGKPTDAGKLSRRPVDRLPRRDRAAVRQQDASDGQRDVASHHREGQSVAAAHRV